MISLKNTLEAIKSKISSHETSITTISANKQNKAWTLIGTCNGSTICTLSSALTNFTEVQIICFDGGNGSSYGWSVVASVPVDALSRFKTYCRSDSHPSIWCGVDGGVRAIIDFNQNLTTVRIDSFMLWGTSQSSYTAFVYAR